MLNYKFKLSEIFLSVRKSNSYNQRELSEKLGVVQSTISKIESEMMNDVSFALVSSFSALFDIRIDQIQKGFLLKSIPSDVKQKIDPSKGLISSKTTFFMLELISMIRDENIYKINKIERSFFSYSLTLYSIQFFHRIYRLYPSEFLEAANKLAQTLEINELNSPKIPVSKSGLHLSSGTIELSEILSKENIHDENFSKAMDLVIRYELSKSVGINENIKIKVV